MGFGNNIPAYCDECDYLTEYCVCGQVVEEDSEENGKPSEIDDDIALTYDEDDVEAIQTLHFQNGYKEWKGLLGATVGKMHKISIRYNTRKGVWGFSIKLRHEGYGETLFDESQIDLTRKLNTHIQNLSGSKGGAIYVNSNKDIIKPIFSNEELKYYYLGNYPEYHPIFSDEYGEFDLADSTGLKIGDVYPYPSIGLLYFYDSTENAIYGFPPAIREEDYIERTRRIIPRSTYCTKLIEKLCRACSKVKGKFFINHHGLVFVYNQSQSNWLFVDKIIHDSLF